MDMEKLAVLETCIEQLLESFARLKEENAQLHQRLSQSCQNSDAHLQQEVVHPASQDEIRHLQTALQDLHSERQQIQKQLEAMLGTIEQLEQGI